MTIEDGHFRTDGKTIEPCCVDMESMEIFGWQGVDDWPNRYFTFIDGKPYLWMSDGDCYPLRSCPCCGAKLEYVKKLEASQ